MEREIYKEKEMKFKELNEKKTEKFKLKKRLNKFEKKKEMSVKVKKYFK